MKIETQQSAPLTEQQIYEKKEKYYKRNFIALCLESFFFTGALSMFSAENVLPAYVENLSDKTWHIAMISVINYGISYGINIFSCPIGVGAKSPKWTSIIVCFLQRIGFLFIFVSTYTVTQSRELALLMFFLALSSYAFSAGMSTPLFSQMVSVSIYKNISSFYGAYQMAGMASSVIGSLLFTRFLTNYGFPRNFRMTFLVGLLSALVATLVVCIGVKEVTDDRVPEKIRIRDVFSISTKLMREIPEFKHFIIIRVMMGAAEFAIPYYIIVAASKDGAPAGFVGILTTIYLIAKMISSVVAGRIGDKLGPLAVICSSCVFGVLAAALAIISTSWQVSTVMYIMLAFAVNGIIIANSSATNEYTGGHSQYVPICSATMNLLCAPLYIIVAFGGAAIAQTFSYSAMFAVALMVYLTGGVLSFCFLKRDRLCK